MLQEERPDAPDGFLERGRAQEAVGRGVGRGPVREQLFDADRRPRIMEDVLVRIVVARFAPVLAPHRGGHHRIGRARGRAGHGGELDLAGWRTQVSHGSPGQAGLVVAEARAAADGEGELVRRQGRKRREERNGKQDDGPLRSVAHRRLFHVSR